MTVERHEEQEAHHSARPTMSAFRRSQPRNLLRRSIGGDIVDSIHDSGLVLSDGL